MTNLPDKYIIRTSDRAKFRNCRREWDFTSKIRANYEPTRISPALELGTAFHAGMEVYYYPSKWRKGKTIPYPVDGTEELAIGEFVRTVQEQLKANPYRDEPETRAEYADRIKQGKAMLQTYFAWARKNDKFWPIDVEREFEVPVLINGEPAYAIRSRDTGKVVELNTHGVAGFDSIPVVYQGRIDIEVLDWEGHEWAGDHKTAARLDDGDDIAWLDIDTQVSSYVWARTVEGKQTSGFFYTQISKSVAKPPKTNKDGSLSVAKNQGTNLQLYCEALDPKGRITPSNYREYLDQLGKQGEFMVWLEENEPRRVQRIQQHRSKREILHQENLIAMEAYDMLVEPNIYPNPSKFNCKYCAFKVPCQEEASSGFGAGLDMLAEDDNFRIRED